ncbi:MAG: hypothetical protein QHI48_04050 [Bacteroidota bacterium]|nr:hypothetical protein [Bacteroidota bacterium]
MRAFRIASVFLLLCVSLLAQETQRTTVVRERVKQDIFSIRVGAWFPRDVERSFALQDANAGNIDQTIDQSQALGIDFQYRYEIIRPVLFDISVGGWYSSYAFRLNQLPVNPTPSLTREADAWVVVIPVTAGLSVNPLPQESSLQPFLCVEGGAYVGVSGTTEWKYDPSSAELRSKNTGDKTLIAFGGAAGAGVDLFLGRSLGVGVAAKYHVVTFKEPLLTQQKDFTGLQIQIGLTMRN